MTGGRKKIAAAPLGEMGVLLGGWGFLVFGGGGFGVSCGVGVWWVVVWGGGGGFCGGGGSVVLDKQRGLVGVVLGVLVWGGGGGGVGCGVFCPLVLGGWVCFFFVFFGGGGGVWVWGGGGVFLVGVGVFPQVIKCVDISVKRLSVIVVGGRGKRGKRPGPRRREAHDPSKKKTERGECAAPPKDIQSLLACGDRNEGRSKRKPGGPSRKMWNRIGGRGTSDGERD